MIVLVICLFLRPFLSVHNAASVLGHIPEELGSLTNLWTLDLGNNQLSGACSFITDQRIFLSLSVGFVVTLRIIRSLPLMPLTPGTIPASMGHLRKLEMVHLDGNRLTGS